SAIISAPRHFHQISREEKQQPDRKQNVIEKKNHEARCRNNTSVAPYFFARVMRQRADSGVFSEGAFSRTNVPSAFVISASPSLPSNNSVKDSPPLVRS